MINDISRPVGDAATVSSLAKNTKANSLRTAKAVARFGKAARHPVCQAALQLWQFDAELLKWAKDICSLSEVLSSAKKQKKQARALLDQFYEEGKQREAIDAAALVRNFDDLLKKTQAAYRARKELFIKWLRKIRPLVGARFAREYENAVRSKDTEALRALQRVSKRWSANPTAEGVPLSDGDQRTLGILKLLHNKVVKGIWAKDGAVSGYWEAAAGGDRLLPDEVWQGRLTAQELRLHLEATNGACVAADRDAKEIRRILRKLGIRPAEDQRGRKWKPPCPAKQKPKKPRGRPRVKPSIRWSDVVLLGADTTPIEAAQARRLMCAGGFDVEIESVPDKEKTSEYSLFEDADALGTGKTWTVKIYSNRELWVVKHEVQKYPIRLLPPNPQNWRLPLPACAEIRGEPESVPQGRSIVFTALLDSLPSGRFYDNFCERPVLRNRCDPEKEEKERSKWRKEAAARGALLTRCKLLKKR
jgi:hypothetical protein